MTHLARSSTTRCFNLADLFEVTADAVPDRLAIVAGDARLTYAALDERATRVANHCSSAGLEAGEHVAVLAANRVEWMETMLGAFKARLVPLNVNYRYTADELLHVCRDGDVVAIVVERGFLPLVAQIRDRLPLVRHVVVLDDGTSEVFPPGAVAYETALDAASPERAELQRSPDDRYILYTGGTTGAPKGVVWRGEDLFFAALAGGNPGGAPISSPDELAERIVPERQPWFVTSPMMHGNGQWNSMVPLLSGRGVVLWTGRRFDPGAIADIAAAESVFLLVLIGDGMAVPMVELLERRGTDGLDHLRMVTSGGAPLAAATKQRLAALLPQATVVDGFGASEMGSSGRMVGKGDGGAPRFTVAADTFVLDDELRPVAAGEVGKLARSGHVPLGYWKDDAKTQATFPVDARGVRWAIPGDLARLEHDGTVTLLGRGSTCINTGGEKVHPEEVAGALKSHPAVADAVVVGVPDPRFGQSVAAVVVERPGTTVELAALREHLRPLLAGYKAPRHLVTVDAIVYTAQAKPDLRWASDVAASSFD
jgi:acyl-CoA synthetase (AMP-forming)/AMP-acid ligase II